MCGIAGAWWRRPPSDAKSKLRAALDAVAHRGPNARKYELHPLNNDSLIGLAHARLSIFDLSDAGVQPMWSPDGRFGLIFNGEIYNFIEIRQTLIEMGETFTTQTDTEVLIRAWMVWGEACLNKLVGMFAFCLYDKQEQAIYLIRDQFGVKPMFYHFDKDRGEFLFGSEAPALLALKPELAKLNWQRSYDYLVYGDYDSDNASFFRDIRHLPPATIVRMDCRTGEMSGPKVYWTPSIAPRTDLSFADATEALREAFFTSVRLHLRSDVPVGFALSGGIDSSAIVSVARAVNPTMDIRTFSFVDQNPASSEERWADLVNDHVGAIPHKIAVAPGDFTDHIDTLVLRQGEPFGSTSIFAQYMVFKRARAENVTVMFEGQGADELLAGYDGYAGARLHTLLETEGPFAAMRFLKAWSSYGGRRSSTALRMMAGAIMPPDSLAFFKRIMGEDVSPSWLDKRTLENAGVQLRVPRMRGLTRMRGRRLGGQLQASTTRQGLPALLRHGDRNAMRFQVENRVPFLTTAFAELALSLPEDYVISPQGETKSVLRAALRGVVPDAILDRRDKVGFKTSELEWFRSHRPWLDATLKRAHDHPAFVYGPLKASVDAVLDGSQPFSWRTWRIVNFLLWSDTFGVAA